ncbi:hypothetical protein ACFQ15_05665 [Sphingomonas hankookensis]|uniref:hypothetical protein n=1 Tax=Sphingomonas hankookensis TaxID=563996 RepID=UPI001F5AC482|nr:hypothetical protein [Sphingomonas hankookensis]
MDEGARIGLYGCMVIAALLGAFVSIEHRRRPHVSADMHQRLLYLVVAVALAASEAQTVRGFIIVLTASIGAYKIARTLVDPVAARVMTRAT